MTYRFINLRLYDASQPPGRHARYFESALKSISVYLFCSIVFPLALAPTHILFHAHLVPRFLYFQFSLDL